MAPKIYELGYTGKEVDEALNRIKNLTPGTGSGGGIVELESSETNPYNLNFLRAPGLYRAEYVYQITAPGQAGEFRSVITYVARHEDGTPDGVLSQTCYLGSESWKRASTDAGVTWSEWVAEMDFSDAEEITADEVYAMFGTTNTAKISHNLLRDLRANKDLAPNNAVPNVAIRKSGISS